VKKVKRTCTTNSPWLIDRSHFACYCVKQLPDAAAVSSGATATFAVVGVGSITGHDPLAGCRQVRTMTSWVDA
jgi:hypothetical protein